MRVAIDVVPIRPGGQVGGASHLVCELIAGLATQYKGDKYVLLTAEWNHDYFKQYEKYGVERICIVNSPVASKTILPGFFTNKLIRRVTSYLKKLFNKKKKTRVLRDGNIDVLLCPMSATTSAEPGIPIVSIIHDLQHEFYPQFFNEQELTHRRKFYKEICETADAVICVSQFTKDTFVDSLNYPPEKAHVVHNGIQDRITIPNTDAMGAVLTKYNLEGIDYGYFPANFWPHKNHQLLLTAYSMFVKRNPNINLHLVFTGALLETNQIIKDAVQQMGLSDQVHFLGYVPEDDLSAILAGCRFLIFPSLFEGFGIPVAEAMSFGKPVLCSNVTSLPEVGGDAALYFDPRRPSEIVTAIERVLADSCLNNHLITAGFKQAEKFNKIEMIKKYRSILHNVAVSGGGNAFKAEGIYGDGWTGPVVEFISGNATKGNVLEIEMFNPGPFPNVVVTYRVNNIPKAKYTVKSGEKRLISQILPDSVSEIEVLINPTFNPSDNGSEDGRDLGLQVQRAEIINTQTGVLIKSIFEPNS
ncbi:MAG: glycosyltransferase family 4 protein [Paludibacter sp.]